MEKFKKKLQIRRVLLVAVILFAVALGIFDVFFSIKTVGESYNEGFLVGFQTGGAIGLGLVAIIAFIRLSIVIKDDTKLKQQYNMENDERLKAIRARSGMPMLIFTSAAMLIAGIVAGYFNPTVFVTLVSAAACQLLVGVVVKAVNMKRM